MPINFMPQHWVLTYYAFIFAYYSIPLYSLFMPIMLFKFNLLFSNYAQFFLYTDKISCFPLY